MLLMEQGHVLVVGSAGINIKGHPQETVAIDTPNAGVVRQTVGGVARNIAENLARLEIDTVLLTAIGRDHAGRRVLRRCQDAGVDTSHVRVMPGQRTGTYLAVLRPDDRLLVAISDFAVLAALDADYLRQKEALFAGAAIIVIDATLDDAALATVFELAGRCGVRVCADPTTPRLAGRLRPYLSQLYMVSPNADETMALCDLAAPAHDHETAIAAARQLVALGVQIAVVTLGENGLAYADGSGGGYIRAIQTQVVDATGAGDAFTGGTIFGLLNDLPIDEAVRLGATAASLTLQSEQAVLRSLNPELLYARLTV
jgi:pseudouridine kinase